jgi:pimeloyl-ACP methyl ester carboxylesterase
MNSIPDVRKAVIHDAAHLPNLEHPEEFNRIVLDFLLAD